MVASIVGHGNSVMTRHYAHISDAAKKNAIMALPVITKPETSPIPPDGSEAAAIVPPSSLFTGDTESAAS